jgi:hypothetical protein
VKVWTQLRARDFFYESTDLIIDIVVRHYDTYFWILNYCVRLRFEDWEHVDSDDLRIYGLNTSMSTEF